MPDTEPTTKRQVWNAGSPADAKRALKPKHIWEIALFDLSIGSKLRGCDLVQMEIGGLLSGGQIRTRAVVMQQKIGLT